MKTYLIVYEGVGFISDLEDSLKEMKAEVTQPLDYTMIAKSEMSLEEMQQLISSTIPENTMFVVLNITNSEADGYLPFSAWKWFMELDKND